MRNFPAGVNLNMLSASGAHMQRRVDELSLATNRSLMTTALASRVRLSWREEMVDGKIFDICTDRVLVGGVAVQSEWMSSGSSPEGGEGTYTAS